MTDQPPRGGCISTQHCASWGWCHRCQPDRSERVLAAWRDAGGAAEDYCKYATDPQYERPPQPSPLTCPMCGTVSEYEWDGEGWTLETAVWWLAPGYPFLDSVHCWRKAGGKLP